MLMRTLCRKTIKKGTPNSPMNGGQGVEVSKTLFYVQFFVKSNCIHIFTNGIDIKMHKSVMIFGKSLCNLQNMKQSTINSIIYGRRCFWTV